MFEIDEKNFEKKKKKIEMNKQIHVHKHRRNCRAVIIVKFENRCYSEANKINFQLISMMKKKNIFMATGVGGKKDRKEFFVIQNYLYK